MNRIRSGIKRIGRNGLGYVSRNLSSLDSYLEQLPQYRQFMQDSLGARTLGGKLYSSLKRSSVQDMPSLSDAIQGIQSAKRVKTNLERGEYKVPQMAPTDPGPSPQIPGANVEDLELD